MNKKTGIIIAAVVVLVIAGVVTALVLNNQSNTDTTSSSNDSSNTNTGNTASSSEFNPVDINTLSYVATSTTTVADQKVTSTIESNGTTHKSTTTTAGMTVESYVTGNEVVTCIDGACSKTTVDPNDEAADAAAVNAAQYKSSAVDQGKQTVNGKEYHAWKVTSEAGEITYYLDDQNRIGKIVFGDTDITYEYKDVTITVPQV